MFNKHNTQKFAIPQTTHATKNCADRFHIITNHKLKGYIHVNLEKADSPFLRYRQFHVHDVVLLEVRDKVHIHQFC